MYQIQPGFSCGDEDVSVALGIRVRDQVAQRTSALEVAVQRDISKRFVEFPKVQAIPEQTTLARSVYTELTAGYSWDAQLVHITDLADALLVSTNASGTAPF